MARRVVAMGLVGSMLFSASAWAGDWTECLKTPQYDAFSYAKANDSWRKPIGRYEIRDEGVGTNRYFKVYFKAADFSDLKKSSNKKCGSRVCSHKVVLKLKSREDADKLRANLVKGRDSATVEIFKAALAEIPGAGWGMSLIDLTMKLSPSVQEIERAQSHLDTLIATDGEVVYEEHLTPQTIDGCFRLTRSVYYEVKVGAEMRRTLLWAARYTAEIHP